jgi:hypothetical protein
MWLILKLGIRMPAIVEPLPQLNHGHPCQGKEKGHLEGCGIWFSRRFFLLYCEEDMTEDQETIIARKYPQHERDEENINGKLK